MDSDQNQRILIDVKLEKVMFDIKIDNSEHILTEKDVTKLSQLLDFFMNYYLKLCFDQIKDNLVKQSLYKGLSVETVDYLSFDQVNDFKLFQDKINNLIMGIAVKNSIGKI